MGLKFQLTDDGLRGYYAIEGHKLTIENVVVHTIPNRNGYPYHASIVIDNHKCATFVNYGDGAIGSFYYSKGETEYFSILRSFEKYIRDNDTKYTTLEKVCERLIELE